MGRSAVCACLCLALSGVQAAEQVGDVLRELEAKPLSPPPEPPAGTPAIELPADSEQQAGSATVTLEGFRFNGNTAFSSDELAALLSDDIGVKLSLSDLYGAASRITAYYREHGWLLARAVLPPQDITEGVLTIQVVEGRYGEIRLNNNSQVPGTVAQRATRNLASGDGVKIGALENALMNLDALPGTRVGSRLSAGSEPGTSDVDVTVSEGDRVTGNLAIDNYGNTYNGAYRLSGGVNIANPLSLGDSLGFQGLVSDEGQAYIRSQYDLPVGPWNTRLGTAVSWLQYRLGDDFEDLNAEGNAATASVFVDQNWWRQRAWGLSSRLTFQYRDLEDEQLGLVSEKTLNSLTLDVINGYWRDSVLAGSSNSIRLNWTFGELRLDSPFAEASDVYGTEGSYHKVSLALLRQQWLAAQWLLQIDARVQKAGTNLDSIEKFSLGGAYGVRAFPQGETSGDEGWLLSTELRHIFNPKWQAGVFMDLGGVKYNDKPLPTGDIHRNLSGAGVSAYWFPDQQWRVSASAATSLDTEEAVSDDPKDVYVWGQVQWTF